MTSISAKPIVPPAPMGLRASCPTKEDAFVRPYCSSELRGLTASTISHLTSCNELAIPLGSDPHDAGGIVQIGSLPVDLRASDTFVRVDNRISSARGAF